MERIKNLKKEVKQERSFSKLKLDLSKTRNQIIRKIVKYIGNELKNVDLTVSPVEYLKFNNFHIEVKKLERENDIKYRRIMRCAGHEGDVYEIIIFDLSNEYVKIYTNPTFKVADKQVNLKYRSPIGNDIYKVLDIHYIYGAMKLLDIVVDEVNKNKEILFNDEFKKVSINQMSYSLKILNDLMKCPTKTNMTLMAVRGFEEQLDVISLIIDTILLRKTSDLNIELTNKYNRETSSECARAFETKKNIPVKYQKIMKNTKLLKDFSYVELDQDIDLKKFNQIEEEYFSIRKILNLDKFFSGTNPELRFKKLGKHRALGLYYFVLKVICVDITSPCSFIHEFGHFIDHDYTDGQLSLQLDFFEIINQYRQAYENDLLSDDIEPSIYKYLKRKRDYFFTPTEIFARMLEVYLANQGIESSFLKTKDELSFSMGYPTINEELKKSVDEYFNKLIEINQEELNIRNRKVINIDKKEKININLNEVIKFGEQIHFNII